MATSKGKLALALAGVIATAVVAVIVATGGSESSEEAALPDPSRFEEEFADAPPPIADLFAQASQVLPGGLPAFEDRLAELEGTPVVVNKWASWCVPCREEFPILQDVSAAHASDVAFLGVDALDSTDAALTFLAAAPLPFPSYSDPEEEIAEAIEADLGIPAMVFYNAAGERTYVHTGPYTSAEDLEADIARYAR